MTEQDYDDETIEMAADLRMPLALAAKCQAYWMYACMGGCFKGKSKALRAELERTLPEDIRDELLGDVEGYAA